MRSILSGELLESGVDYMTATGGSALACDRMERLASSIAAWELKGDFIGRPWSVSGYQGAKVGGLEYGVRHDGCMIRLHSEVAFHFWRLLYDAADHITRIDLQCTFRVTLKPSEVVHRHYIELSRRKRQCPKGPQVSRTTNSNGGYTAYTGSRQSDRFGRIYNKWAKTPIERYRDCVRYEQQFGGERAARVSAEMRRGEYKKLAIAGHVLEFFESRGCSISSLRGCEVPLTKAFVDELPRRKTDVERRRAWIQKSVAPTLRLLMDHGESRFLADCLGLPASMELDHLGHGSTKL